MHLKRAISLYIQISDNLWSISHLIPLLFKIVQGMCMRIKTSPHLMRKATPLQEQVIKEQIKNLLKWAWPAHVYLMFCRRVSKSPLLRRD